MDVGCGRRFDWTLTELAQTEGTPASMPHTSHTSNQKGATEVYPPGLRARQDRPTGEASRSKRRLTWRRRAAYALIAPVIKLSCRLLWLSCRIDCVLGQEVVERVLSEDKPIIPCYWHQCHIFCVYYMLQLNRLGLRVGCLLSPSLDGEVPAKIMRSWGVRVIRASSTRSGAQAIREIYRLIISESISPVITSDGPTGPAREFKPGGAILARLAQVPMIPFSYAAKSYWRLQTWDQFVIPKPFTRIVIAVGEPQWVPSDVPANALGPYQESMQNALNGLARQAERALKG